MNTGSPQFGRPSMGSWVTYGIGSESQTCRASSCCSPGRAGRAAARLCGAAASCRPSYQGVPFRSGGEPILNLCNSARHRRHAAAADSFDAVTRPEPRAAGRRPAIRKSPRASPPTRWPSDADQRAGADRPRPARRRQRSKLYGAEPGKPSFANNCLLARRLVERGVRFVQLYHTDWDHHGNRTRPGKPLDERLPRSRPGRRPRWCKDLKQRGLLDDTLVIWGGEFGRTPMGETARRSRPRPPHRRLHDVAGRRRHQGRPDRSARPTSFGFDRRRGPRPRPRPAGHDPAPAGPRSHEADLPLPGPRLPPDRRRTATW